jgi:hypothetical protein
MNSEAVGSKNDFTVEKIIKLKNCLTAHFLELPKYEWNSLDLKKIHALDIETYLDANNNFVPYAIGYYDGQGNSPKMKDIWGLFILNS